MTVGGRERVNGTTDVPTSEGGEAEDPSRKPQTRRRLARAGMRSIRRVLARWRPIVMTATVIVAVGIAAGLFVGQYRPNQQTDHAAAASAIKAASEGTVAILSYSPATVDQDSAVATSHLTGEFLRYYRDFSQHFLAPAVRQQNVKASAAVLRAAVSELHPDSAVVLVFVHQTTVSKEKPEPVLTANGVRVTLAKVGASWLISRFEPV